jgi:hypothetical protein
LLVVVLLIIPERFYNRYVGRFVPTRAVMPDAILPATESAGGE